MDTSPAKPAGESSSPRGALPRPLLAVLALTLLSLPGCRHNCDLVEAELRTKQEQLDILRHEIGCRDSQIQALEMQIDRLQRQCQAINAPLPVGSAVVVKEIGLGRLTGGYDQDPSCPGDEGLQVLLEPRDCDNQSIKAPGALRIEVYEITPQGFKQPLSSWDLAPRELRTTWDTPVFGSPAYRVLLPWRNQPNSEKLRVVAQFTTLDGQRYEADKDVTVRLVPLPIHSPHTVIPPPPEPAGPPPVDVVPPPASVLPPPTGPAHPPEPPGPYAPARPYEPPPAAPAAPVEPPPANRLFPPALSKPMDAPPPPAAAATPVNAAAARPAPAPPFAPTIKPPVNARRAPH